MKQNLDGQFFYLLRCAIDTQLITYKDYVPMCDWLIMNTEDTHRVILELTTEHYSKKAVQILCNPDFYEISTDNEIAQSVSDNYTNLWISNQFIRYQRKEISWATFLLEAGKYSDSTSAYWDCDEFYTYLNDLEDNDFSPKIESQQVVVFKNEFNDSINQANQFYAQAKKWKALKNNL